MEHKRIEADVDALIEIIREIKDAVMLMQKQLDEYRGAAAIASEEVTPT